MNTVIRVAAALVLAVSLLAAPCAAQRKSKAVVPGEDSFRSAAGYHTAVMEHCKQINKLARGRGDFNVTLAREHGAEVGRNLAAAVRHQAQFEAVNPQATSSSVAACERHAKVLEDALKAASPDRKAVAAAATELFLAERELVTSQKAAAKSLGISMATTPRKASATPRKRTKPAPASGEVSAAKPAVR